MGSKLQGVLSCVRASKVALVAACHWLSLIHLTFKQVRWWEQTVSILQWHSSERGERVVVETGGDGGEGGW